MCNNNGNKNPVQKKKVTERRYENQTERTNKRYKKLERQNSEVVRFELPPTKMQKDATVVGCLLSTAPPQQN